LTIDKIFVGLRPEARNNAKGRDNSRSAKAFREGARLRREGKSFEEMCDALRNHADPDLRAWYREKGEANNLRHLRLIWEKTAPPEEREGVSLDDFYAFMPMHNYIFAPARMHWPGSSVNSRIRPIKLTDAKGAPIMGENGKQVGLSASAWLDRFRAVEQMTWAPGLPMIIEDKLIIEGGWIDRLGVRCFNLYLPPRIIAGDADKAGPWLDHLKYVFPEDAEHILDWMAHRVQYPNEKINHALVLGGNGIGKDSILEPVTGARQGRGRTVEFPGGVTQPSPWPLQRLSEVCRPARQRGARPR
jgi:hypothetical protein